MPYCHTERWTNIQSNLNGNTKMYQLLLFIHKWKNLVKWNAIHHIHLPSHNFSDVSTTIRSKKVHSMCTGSCKQHRLLQCQNCDQFCKSKSVSSKNSYLFNPLPSYQLSKWMTIYLKNIHIRNSTFWSMLFTIQYIDIYTLYINQHVNGTHSNHPVNLRLTEEKNK